MKINNNVIPFAGIILISLIVSQAGSALTGSTNDIPDSVIRGNITDLRAMEGVEGNTRFNETHGQYVTKTANMNYIITVNIVGSPTYTYSGTIGRDGNFDVVYDMNLDAKGIALQKMAAIQGYAYQRWGYNLLNKDVIWKPYSKGS
ncbi:MAG: hypothetical protein KJ888_20300 [Gammaproteobacteria bacterium]|uniref:Uncharacterized protein n=1 Tax=viral metagenome TaxID=1070528 RepID=A0A6M3LB31_9ZZZZ|nr:hypothetical protein [Gammaproteobacteria bacterium]